MTPTPDDAAPTDGPARSADGTSTEGAARAGAAEQERAASTRPTRVVAHVPDLMDRSKLARLGDVEVVHVARPADLADVVRVEDLVVLDLARPGVLDALRAGLAGTVVGFASHVDRDLIAAATDAGCAEVLPRSAFFPRLADRLA